MDGFSAVLADILMMFDDVLLSFAQRFDDV